MTVSSDEPVYFHAALARSLAENGVQVMFGVIGDANLYMVNAFVRDQGGRFISASNEAGATAMALGYASLLNQPGVATVTHGPALTNTLTALVEGVKGQTPMVLVCGDTNIEVRGGLQDVPQRELIVATGAGFEQLRAPSTLSEDVATAFRRAVLERRPIALNVPTTFQWQEVVYRSELQRLPRPQGRCPSGEEFDNAIGVIAAARRPVILAGRGAIDSEAKAAILRLATRIGAPVATTLRAKGLFSGEDFNLGVFGTLSTPIASEVIQEADCVIAFGASLNAFTTARGGLLGGKRVIQCNTEAADIARTYPVDAALVGDPTAVAEALVHWLDAAEVQPSGYRTDELDARLRGYSRLEGLPDASTSRTVDARRAVHRIGEVVPPDRVLVTDGGRFLGVAWQFLDVVDPYAYIHTIHFGSIGLGMPYAIGAAAAAEGRPVLLVTGDGGFMLGGLAEFNTAVRHKLDLIVVVCNDSSYGAEHIQFRSKNMDPALSIFEWPEFADVAVALGGSGVAVRNKFDLDLATEAIAKRAGPLLIDLKLDPDAVPPIPA